MRRSTRGSQRGRRVAGATPEIRWAAAPAVALLAWVLGGAIAYPASVTTTFLPMGSSEQMYVVPAGVDVVHVVVTGGAGGDGENPSNLGKGGLGGVVTADLSVDPGQTLYLRVGTNGPAGGTVGGGAGGSANGDGGQGGGASIISTCSVQTAGCTASDPLAVAGGGGGGGGGGTEGIDFRGGNGGTAGAPGGPGFTSSALLTRAGGGGGATIAAPGSGGAAGAPVSCSGDPGFDGASGSALQGGNGGGGFGGFGGGVGGGGGGGGGYFGGGGGGGGGVADCGTDPLTGGGGGGGGGSSFARSTGVDNVTFGTAGGANPSIVITADDTPVTTTSAPPTTSTTLAMTTTTSAPTTTTTSTPPDPTTTTLASTTTTVPVGPSLTIDDEVLTNGSRGRVTGTITCEAGRASLLELTLAQGGDTVRGTARDSCTGSPQSFAVAFNTRGLFVFDDGVAQACLVASTGDLGDRSPDADVTSCEEVFVARS